MNDQPQGVPPIVLFLLAGLFVFYVNSHKTPSDDKVPVPDVAPSVVAMEIRSALSSAPKGTATAYGAFYDACAATLETDTSPVQKLRVRMERAKALLKLSSPSAFGDIVVRELGRFGEGTIDRQKYAEAFRKLSSQCKEAEQ